MSGSGSYRLGRRNGPKRVTGARPLLAALVAASLITGLVGGLLRLGIAWPLTLGDWTANAALAHGALMTGGFLGTVIGIERAVAVKLRWSFAAPAASGLAGLALAAGQDRAGAWLLALAASIFVAVNVVVVRRQIAAHTLWLWVAACAWLTGNLLYVSGAGQSLDAVLAWWFAFLVITIAAERLEMTRLMRRRPAAQPALVGILAALLFACSLAVFWPRAGGLLYGISLLLLAAWLAQFDIARRTLAAGGLSRYMAVCLLSGYAWLAAAGIAWAALALGYPLRDLALHALGLGFIFSMVMAHGPVILPAVVGIKLAFGAWFYVPLVVLNASLLWRVAAGFADPAQRAAGGAGNAAAILLFAATVLASALVWRWSRR